MNGSMLEDQKVCLVPFLMFYCLWSGTADHCYSTFMILEL